MTDIAKLAETVDEAAQSATAIAQLTFADPDLSGTAAYAIQRASIARRLGRGERLVGMKMGLTSRAKMAQVGVDEMVWGRLTDKMRIEDGGAISRAKFIHPRAEPEIAFLMGRRLEGAVSPAEAMAAVEAVAAAIEVIDSRYENFKFTFPDVVADNSSSSAFAVGPWASPYTDVGNLGMVMEIDGRAKQIGSSAAILGHPARSLAAAARLLAEEGMALEEGWIVLAGGATAAEPLSPGMHVRLVAQGLGQVAFSVGA
ncbi:MAG TPA: fumarylacetoacetate hydrolase family protein [Hyphomicrobiales bacterium]|nr:fumarylacetoacetate hydrolase family protein [Kaistiaceae bacterium]HQF31746.1 fumarylacetoacetate hydrolase family protein [Hyphomicrobiales bacterium]